MESEINVSSSLKNTTSYFWSFIDDIFWFSNNVDNGSEDGSDVDDAIESSRTVPGNPFSLDFNGSIMAFRM